MILEEFAFSFAFNLRKQNVPDFPFHLFGTKLCAVALYINYNCQALQVSPYYINSGLSDNGCSSVPLASASFLPWYLVLPNSHIQKQVISECVDMEMLFSL